MRHDFREIFEVYDMGKSDTGRSARHYSSVSSSARARRQREKLQKQRKRAKIGKRVGIVLSVIQLILSVICVGYLKFTGLIPTQYLMIVVIVLAALFLVAFLTQFYKKGRIPGKIVSVLTSAVLCAIAFVVFAGFNVLSSITGDNNFDGNITKDPFIVYLSGNDTYGELDEDGRSDTNILAVVNPTSNDVLLLSTPRDSYLALYADYDFDVTDGFSGDGCYDKLTHAGNYGLGVSIGSLENLYNIDCDFYVRMNFTGFVEIVDALGGVTIENETEFTSRYGYYFPAGTLDLDGEYTLHYVRERYSFATGDMQRGKNQMKVIKALIQKALSPSVLAGYSDILASVEDNFETNLSQGNISALVQMQLLTGADWNIVSFSVSGESTRSTTYSTSSSVSVLMLDDTDVANAKALIEMVLNGETITQDYADGLAE